MVLDLEPRTADVSRRVWPAPTMPWAMAMQWHDLLFMHWPVAPETMRRVVPPTLDLDLFDGQAWLGIVPFSMAGVRARFSPPIPGTARFPELNVRTYVTRDGKPGVYFFSLDAANPLAVRAARAFFHLPYYDARMSSTIKQGTIAYASTRVHRHAAPAALLAHYRPMGPTMQSRVGSLDAWLTDRYCLYAAGGRRVWRSEIEHARWPLQAAEVEIERNTMAAPLRLSLPERPALVHHAPRLDVVAWLPVQV